MSGAAAATNRRRVLIIAGSNRRQYACPGVDSKARMLALRMADRLPTDWEVDFEDLGNVDRRPRIQPCNACVSTSMALCVWPCNCYERGNRSEPDLMWDLDLYARLERADAWAIIGPINWYGPTSTLKLMFDRLVCMNGGNPREDLIRHKDPELAMQLERSPEWRNLSENHLEGRTAGFFCYGDRGGDEVDEDGRPRLLRHAAYFDPFTEPFDDDRDAYAPLVWQCRFSGIEVPDDLWAHADSGVGRPYADNQAEDMMEEDDVIQEFDSWTARFAAFVAMKDRAHPAARSAIDFEPPSHRLADLRLRWRGLRMMVGRPRSGSSPEAQQRRDLNSDRTLRPKSSSAHSVRVGRR